MAETHPGRQILIAWEEAKPTNFYTDHRLLRSVVRRMTGGAADDRLVAFGSAAAGTIDRAAKDNDRLLNHPQLDRYDHLGARTEGIHFNPLYHEVGRAVYESGILSDLAAPGRIWHSAALFLLLCMNGEAGHACPVTCTAGMIRALQLHGSDELQRRWLPGLLARDYDRKLHASQFLTEVQGGSDVGANVVEAVPDPDVKGAYRITGEKWFCSVADAPLFLLTARPAGAPSGTRGLGCFLVPRTLDDGSPNGFVLRRLKDKIGTRTMASGEIDFEESLAYPIGRLDEGFKIAVGVVLNTSRFFNALGSTGEMRRAYVEALSFARHREAFGAPIANYPLVRRTLATMKAEEAAAVLSTFHLAGIIDRMDAAEATDEDRRVHRILVNANKYWTSIRATDVIHDGIEVLGGNGTIETFSILPRLYRDAIGMESWEGSHNVLCMQVLRDAAKLDLVPAMDARFRSVCPDTEAGPTGRLIEAWDGVRARLDRCVSDPAHGAMHLRRSLEEMMAAFQIALLLDHAESDDALRGELTAAAKLLFDRHLNPGYRADEDPGYAERVDAVLGADVG